MGPTAIVEPRTSTRSSMARLATWCTTHPCRAAFGVALVARVVVAVGVWQFHHGTLYEDDAMYVTMARQRALGQEHLWDEYTHILYNRTSTFLIPLSWLYHGLTGTLPGQLFVAVIGATVAALAARLVARATTKNLGLAAGLVVALLPSQVVLSSLALKDGPVWLLLAATAVLLATPREPSRWHAVGTAGAVAVLLVLLAHLRLHTFVTTCLALAVVTVLLARWWRPERSIGVVSVAAVVPLVMGLGPFGIGFVTDSAASIGDIRVSNARGDAAIGAAQAPTTTAPPVTSPRPSSGPGGSPSASTSTSTTAVPQATASDTDGATTDIRYLPHGIFALLFEPVPWRSGGGITRKLAQAESLLWYPLLLLATLGLVSTVRRRSLVLVMAFPVVVGAGTLVMWSLIEGNLGTAYRHRGEFSWVICCLAVLGADWLRRQRAAT